MTVRTDTSQDLIPLAERMRWMRAFRLGATALVLLAAVLLGDLHRSGPGVVAVVAAVYLAVTLGGEAAWQVAGRRGLPLFGALLMVDGLFLAWSSQALALPSSPVRYLIVVHLVTVTLLASFRTGGKLALWHSLLLFAIFHGREAGVLGEWAGGAAALGDVEYRTLIGSVAVIWVAAGITASFASVNERELRRRRYDLEALARLAGRLEFAMGPAAVATTLLDEVADAFGFTRVLFFAAPGDDLELLGERGASAAATDANRGPGAVLATAMDAQEPVLVSRFAADQDPWLAALLPDARNLVLLPLRADGRHVGVLVCEHGLRHGSRIERRVVSMLQRFASQTALALSNAWLVERLERSAATDGLTGVPNRRTFDAALGAAVARALRDGDPVSVVMVDIDRFKQLNDVHGHLTGDAVLRGVARALDDARRTTDVLARYGGEEFGVIMPGTDRDAALAAAERLREAVAAARTDVPVTASFGVASAPADEVDPTALVRAADAGLYAAKRAGRDCVRTGSATGHLE